MIHVQETCRGTRKHRSESLPCPKPQAYFANYIRPGKPTRLFLEEKLKERSRMQNESTSLSPYETYNPLTGERSYCGVPLPADAPPRPNGRATWDNLKQSWI